MICWEPVEKRVGRCQQDLRVGRWLISPCATCWSTELWEQSEIHHANLKMGVCYQKMKKATCRWPKSEVCTVSDGLMKGSVDLEIPAGAEVVGATLTVETVGSLSIVFASKIASSLLNLSDHFWSNSSILASAEDL